MSPVHDSAPELRPAHARGRFGRLALLSVPLLIPVAFPPPPAAADIDAALRQELSRISPAETVPALFILDRQADVPALDAALKLAHATRQERHRRVVEALRAQAKGSQRPLLEEVSLLSERGEVTAYASWWIVNAVGMRATRDAIEELAGRTDVSAIAPGFRAIPDPVQGTAGARGVGVPQGLRAIHAPRVWYELGINGAGALIGILDTGADGNHPALHDRWRGNNGHPWQECWHDVTGPGTDYPDDDPSGHGTHVTGTLTGLGAATEDTIGVAWGAQWIAANAIRQGVGHEFDFDVLDCLQWFADPDGDPNTVDDVPDVVLNAWGVNESFSGYTDCDSRWWPAIDNCEAAGIVMIWSAGGDGPAAGTIRSPGDRATTAYNTFSVGAVDATHSDFPYPVTNFSSRGPSGCDVPDPLRIKPEVVAPGVDVYSSYPGGTYQVWSGTAMATAHVGGVVALMRSADPDLEVDTIKQVLMETARDGGEPGEDNAYGWGTIDAYEAVVRFAAVVYGENGRAAGGVWLAARPNPLSGATTLRFRIEASGPATLEVFDPGGRVVRSILSGTVSTGEHTAIWDGRDMSGRAVRGGVYLLRLRTAEAQEQVKLLVIR